MLARVPVVDVAVSRLAARPLGVSGIHGLGRAALRTGAPKLLDVLALRASDGFADAATVAVALDATGRWPDACLSRPHDALALATVWAVGDEAVRAQGRARAAYGDILDRVGPGPFADAESSAFLCAQLAHFAGDRREVERLLGILPLSAAERADLRLDLANPYAAGLPADDPAHVRWLALFNERFATAGLAPIAVDPAAEHPFDGLTARGGESVDGPLVTVIVPCFRPDAGLVNSIRSMAAQTYGNLEILLVDDASGPGYAEVVDEALALDSRVEVIRMPVNGGSYLGRNEAIMQARGHFVTTQDSDDWSHPQRIADQVRLLRDNPFAPASRSDAIRALDDLTVSWLGYPSRRRNASSFMVRRSTIETVGVFDTVRKGADSEYHERVERRLGPTLDTSTPLAITRLRGGSLSRSDFRMLWMTPDRALYRASFRAWHDAITPTTPPLRGAEQLRRRAFPASWSFRRNLPGGTAPRTAYDVVALVDLTSPSAWTEEPTRSLLMDRARTTALIFQEDPTSGRPRRPETLAKAMSPVLSGRVDLISASDAAQTDLLVVLTPGLLEMPSLDVPAVRAERIVALLPAPRAGVSLDLLAMREGARAAFGREVSYAAPTPEEAADWSLDLGEAVPSLAELLETVTWPRTGAAPSSGAGEPRRVEDSDAGASATPQDVGAQEAVGHGTPSAHGNPSDASRSSRHSADRR